MVEFNNGLFIFRRDFRITDNSGLNEAATKCKNIIPIFIFTPEQVTSKNEYKSKNAIQFMIESLESLEKEIKVHGGKLYIFYGNNSKIVKDCISFFNVDYVCFNKDYTPYALERDNEIENLCKNNHIMIEKIDDYYLNPPGSILTHSGEPYKKFTPYYNVAKTKIHPHPSSKKINFLIKREKTDSMISLDDAFSKFVGKENEQLIVYGGRNEAIEMLKHAVKSQKNYSKTRNDLTKPTSRMSAYIKFGCVSIREVYKAFRNNHELVRQLIWRDFYAQILFFFPYVLGHPMKKTLKIQWHKNSRFLDAWKNGYTGFPIVDACMRELNTTGYMHNRGRLIVSSFLTKTLLISWREGEKYFATQLTDYDAASNNGNWQWNASTGVDSQPYFRIFNPWSQGKENDPEANYIKMWVPELNELSAETIHNWNTTWMENKDTHYPKPIVQYEEQKEKALKMFHDAYH